MPGVELFDWYRLLGDFGSSLLANAYIRVQHHNSFVYHHSCLVGRRKLVVPSPCVKLPQVSPEADAMGKPDQQPGGSEVHHFAMTESVNQSQQDGAERRRRGALLRAPTDVTPRRALFHCILSAGRGAAGALQSSRL